jgi:excisionase family DNA binding protein
MPRLLNTREAAEYVGLAPETLESRRVRGGSPVFVRLGRAVRYRLADLDAWVEAHAVAHKHTTDPGVPLKAA